MARPPAGTGHPGARAKWGPSGRLTVAQYLSLPRGVRMFLLLRPSCASATEALTRAGYSDATRDIGKMSNKLVNWRKRYGPVMEHALRTLDYDVAAFTRAEAASALAAHVAKGLLKAKDGVVDARLMDLLVKLAPAKLGSLTAREGAALGPEVVEGFDLTWPTKGVRRETQNFNHRHDDAGRFTQRPGAEGSPRRIGGEEQEEEEEDVEVGLG